MGSELKAGGVGKEQNTRAVTMIRLKVRRVDVINDSALTVLPVSFQYTVYSTLASTHDDTSDLPPLPSAGSRELWRRAEHATGPVVWHGSVTRV